MYIQIKLENCFEIIRKNTLKFISTNSKMATSRPNIFSSFLFYSNVEIYEENDEFTNGCFDFFVLLDQKSNLKL